LPQADRGQPAGLARPARARPAPRRAPEPGGGAGALVRSAGAPSARPRAAPGDLADTLGAEAAARARRPLRDADARFDLLSRSPRLPALPLPQHGAPLAVPALPRVEYLRRRTHRPRERRGRSLGSASHCHDDLTQRPQSTQRTQNFFFKEKLISAGSAPLRALWEIVRGRAAAS